VCVSAYSNMLIICSVILIIIMCLFASQFHVFRSRESMCTFLLDLSIFHTFPLLSYFGTGWRAGGGGAAGAAKGLQTGYCCTIEAVHRSFRPPTLESGTGQEGRMGGTNRLILGFGMRITTTVGTKESTKEKNSDQQKLQQRYWVAFCLIWLNFEKVLRRHQGNCDLESITMSQAPGPTKTISLRIDQVGWKGLWPAGPPILIRSQKGFFGKGV
jgi:hypothetical protein